MVTPTGSAICESPVRPRAPGLGSVLAQGGLRARILAGAGANLVGQAVTAGIQLLSLPLFLHFWDTARYGKWVMLSAVPAYFSMSDGGMIPVAANKIAMLRASGDAVQANAVFQSALALVVAAVCLIAGATGLVLIVAGDGILDGDSRLALWLLVLATLVSLFGGLFDAGFRASGNYAEGVLLGNAVRAFEFLGLATGLAVGGTLATAAFGALAGRCAGSLALGQYCRRRFRFLRWGLAEASLRELHALLRPALAFMAFPLGNALSIQAVTLIVGGLFGTVAVAVFNTYRTLSRLVIQLTSTFSLALWAEFSRLFGAQDRVSLQNLYYKALRIGAAISVLVSVGIIPAAPYLLRWWTHGKIGFDLSLFLLFAAATLVGGLSHVPRVLLLSTNSHSRFGALYLSFSAIGLAMTWIIAKPLGPNGAVLATIALEMALLVSAAALARRAIASLPREARHGAG